MGEQWVKSTFSHALAPFRHMYAPSCTLRTHLRAVWWSHLEMEEECRLEDIYIYMYILHIYIISCMVILVIATSKRTFLELRFPSCLG